MSSERADEGEFVGFALAGSKKRVNISDDRIAKVAATVFAGVLDDEDESNNKSVAPPPPPPPPPQHTATSSSSSSTSSTTTMRKQPLFAPARA
jgi:hypothetical protein